MHPKMLSTEAANYLGISLQAIHKQLKTNKLEYHKASNKLYFTHETARQIFNLKFTPSCWSWQNLKGGVGKTHLSFSTAVRLSLYGAKVALLDLDQQGNLTQACGIDAGKSPVLIDVIQENLSIVDSMVNVHPGIDILPSRIDNAVLDNVFSVNNLPVDRELKKRIKQLKNHYDFIFLDCSPSLGAVVTAAALSADHIIIPVDPERFSLSGLDMTLSQLKEKVTPMFDHEFNTRIVLNKFDGRTTLSHHTLTTLFEHEEYRERLFKTFIRTSQELPNSVVKNKSVFDNLRPSTAKEDLDLLTIEIMETSIIKTNEETNKEEVKEETFNS